jgi:hypothetical protein
MNRMTISALLLLSSTAMAADFDEAALKTQMREACAPLFAAGGECADLAKGTRKCTRQNASKGGSACVAFEKAHKDFFDAGMNDPIIKK